MTGESHAQESQPRAGAPVGAPPAASSAAAPPASGSAPVGLTEGAARKVLALLEREKLSPAEAGLRVAVIGGGCSGLSYKLSFEKQPRGRDKVYVLGGVRVFVDPKSALYLQGVEVDFIDGLNGSGFTFQNPGAKGTCGCGTSFSA